QFVDARYVAQTVGVAHGPWFVGLGPQRPWPVGYTSPRSVWYPSPLSACPPTPQPAPENTVYPAHQAFCECVHHRVGYPPATLPRASHSSRGCAITQRFRWRGPRWHTPQTTPGEWAWLSGGLEDSSDRRLLYCAATIGHLAVGALQPGVRETRICDTPTPGFSHTHH